MRIRKSSPTSSAIAPLSPSTSTSSFVSSSTHSTISTQSPTSSSNSASSSRYATNSPTKCEGLDLLVKAVYYVVAGSVIGVPYIQKRVIRRRKRALSYSNLIVRGHEEKVKLEEEDVDIKEGKRRKTIGSGLSWKFEDPVVFQSWKPPVPPSKRIVASRIRRGGSKIGKSGSG